MQLPSAHLGRSAGRKSIRTTVARAGAAGWAAVSSWGARRRAGRRPRARGTGGRGWVSWLGDKAPRGEGAGAARRAALRGPPRFGGARSEVTARALPRRRGNDQPVGQAVGDRFVVDPPTVEVRPGLLGGAFDGEADLLEHLHSRLELAEGKSDRRLWQRVGIQVPAEHGADPVQAGEPHPQAQPGVR